MQQHPTLMRCAVRMAPPAATVAAKAAQRDPRAAVSFADRVPYVVVHGPPSAPPLFRTWMLFQTLRLLRTLVWVSLFSCG